jgi:putative restriction endonuclease
VASHILTWADNFLNRLNPANGICLCSIHDRAFELGYIGIAEDYRIQLSNELTAEIGQDSFQSFFKRHEDMPIHLPDKFYPNTVFLKQHLQEVFRK